MLDVEPVSLHLTLCREGLSFTGMDLAERMLDLCARHFSRLAIDRTKYTLTSGNVLDPISQRIPYDGILALGFLQYQGDEGKALAALCDLLRPGGILLLSGPARIKISSFFGLPDAIKIRFGLQKAGSQVLSETPDVQVLLRISVNTYSISKLLEQADPTLIDRKGHGCVHFQMIGRWLNFRRELFLRRTLTKLARFMPIDRFGNDLVVVGRKTRS